MNEARVERTVVVLSSMVWRTELESELERIGVPADQAQRSAGHLLGRIVRHAGYLHAFMYDSADERDISPVGGVEHRAQSRSNGRRPPGEKPIGSTAASVRPNIQPANPARE